MVFNGLMGYFYRICEIVFRLLYLNVLWIIFTLLGVGIFGFMPATVAAFTITRKWIEGEDDVPVFKLFWNSYKKDFLKTNILGFILIVLGYILYIDFVFLPTDQGIFFFLRIVLIMCTILYLIVLLYIFPLYVYYKQKFRFYLKNALLLGISYPHFTFGLFVFILLWYYVLESVQILIPLFSVSVFVYVNMWFVNKVIKKVEEVNHKNEN